MWYLIKRIIKDPCSPSILRVQCVVDGEAQEYASQDKVKNAIQRKCEIRFSLAHSVPIMNTLLGERLQYLSDETIARAIMLDTYNIPTDLNPAPPRSAHFWLFGGKKKVPPLQTQRHNLSNKYIEMEHCNDGNFLIT
jgi:hypothetical protein